MYQVLDRLPGDSSALSGLSDLAHHVYRGIRDMSWHAGLLVWSGASAGVGLVAQMVGAPPELTWSFVALSTIPLLTLCVRAVYSYRMRRLDHEERLALIAKGITPPPLVPFGAPKNPPAVPTDPTTTPPSA